MFAPKRDYRATVNKPMPHIKWCSLTEGGGINVQQQPLPQGCDKSQAIPSVDLTYTCGSLFICNINQPFPSLSVLICVFPWNYLTSSLYTSSFISSHVIPPQLLSSIIFPLFASSFLHLSVTIHIPTSIPPPPGLYCTNCAVQKSSPGEIPTTMAPLCHLEPDPGSLGIHLVPQVSS